MALSNAQTKKNIKAATGLTVMVRNYNAQTFSVWLFPKDRNQENRDALERYFAAHSIERVGLVAPGKPFGNSGEYNSLKYVA